jgi:dihydroorotase
MGELQAAGCIAVSDDGKPVPTAGLFRRALEYARTFGMVLIEHAEDPSLSAGGCMNEGPMSTRLGLPGVPAVSEIAAVARDVAVAEAVGGRLHIAHVSTEGALRIIREARARGVDVTCEVTPHHLWLTDEACQAYDTHFKMNPPLRTRADRDALRQGLADGTIDALATDHAPHSRVDKEMEFERAAFGVTGLETALPLLLELCREGVLGVSDGIARLTSGPARVLGLLSGGAGTLAPGAAADVTVIDPDLEHVYQPAHGLSKSKNSAFAGRALRGQAVLAVVGGRVVHELTSRAARARA